MTAPRTRFAPSPTGFLHLGSARTALYSWAYARRFGGEMVLRMEDTDRERSTLESERALLDGLEWLGIDWDGAVIRQSERYERYAEVIQELLESDNAYRCVCTVEELEARKQATIAAGGKWTYDGLCRDANYGDDCGAHTVRLRLPESGPLDWDDLVFGPSGQDAREIGDRIIRRTDGTALYHLAVVVDDLDTEITHVIRGADHQPNTPFHLALYRALDKTPPKFAHVPLILAESGKKLSKRRDAVSIQGFRDDGYLAAALRNWIIRIGWSHGDQEVFSADEIVSMFDLDAVGRTGARADRDKLAWLNHHYIQTLPADELMKLVDPFLADSLGSSVEPSEALSALIDLNRQRGKTLVELAAHTRWLVAEPLTYDEKAAHKHLKPAAGELLRQLGTRLDAVPEWNEQSLAAVFDALCEERGVKLGKIAQPVRVALTGGTVSPGIYETLGVVGRDRSLARIEAAAAYAEAAAG
jgi:glutamyl-tRNA synthetase